jgi:hypothetical protein
MHSLRRNKTVLNLNYSSKIPHHTADTLSHGLITTNQVTLHREIIAVCSQIHTEHITVPCGQQAEFMNVKHDGTHTATTWI